MTTIAKKKCFRTFNQEIMVPIYLSKKKDIRSIKGSVDEGSIVAIKEQDEKQVLASIARTLFGKSSSIESIFNDKTSAGVNSKKSLLSNDVERITKQIDKEIEDKLAESASHSKTSEDE